MRMAQSKSHAASSKEADSGHEVESYKAADYALGLIQRAVANRQNIGISGGATGELYVFPELGEYLSLLQDSAGFFTMPAKELQVRILATEEVDGLMETLMFGRNLDELIWIAAQASAKGRLLTSCKPTDVLQLKHWPNLTRIACNPSTLRLTAFFAKAPSSMFVARRVLGIPQGEINEFYSAAKAAGLVEMISGQNAPKAEKLKPHRNRSMLEKIMNRVSSL